MSKETKTIHAVHENDLKRFMKKLGLWKDYKKGTLKCGKCETIITDENLAGFKPINKEPKAICSKCLFNI